MATKPQCFAYSGEGMRCEKPAGHAGNHLINISWDDSECYIPTAPPRRPLSPTSWLSPNRTPLMEDVLPEQAQDDAEATLTEHGYTKSKAKPTPPSTAGCVACGHKHRGAECKCGCYEFIG